MEAEARGVFAENQALNKQQAALNAEVTRTPISPLAYTPVIVHALHSPAEKVAG